jgi:hypothetical protein
LNINPGFKRCLSQFHNLRRYTPVRKLRPVRRRAAAVGAVQVLESSLTHSLKPPGFNPCAYEV